MRTGIAAFLVLTMLSSSGCSIVLMNRPPESPPPRGQAVECTDTPVAPIVDTVLTLGAIAAGVAVLASASKCPFNDVSCSSTQRETNRIGGGISFGVLGAVTAISAVKGYGFASRCSAMKAAAAQQRP